MYEEPSTADAYRPPTVETLRYGNGLTGVPLPNLPVVPPEPAAPESAHVPVALFIVPLVAFSVP